jgi:AcrR family transcriptional regulator
MAGRCSICVHPERDVIETDLVSGATTRDIAGRFGVSRSAVSRHGGAHLPIEVVTATATRDVERVQTLEERLEELYARAEAILEQVEAAGRHNVALAGIKELRGILEFAAKMATVASEPVTIQLSFRDSTPADRPIRAIEAKPQPGERRTLEGLRSSRPWGSGARLLDRSASRPPMLANVALRGDPGWHPV